MKGYKVTDVSANRRVGICCNTFTELLEKGRQKLKLPANCEVTIVLEDGTEVENDEYFQSLKQQTLIIFLCVGQKWKGFEMSKLEHIFSQLIKAGGEKAVVQGVRKLMSSENHLEKLKLLGDFIAVSEMNIKAETRDEHPEWFEGEEPRFKTKTDVMKNCASRRIRGYLTDLRNSINQETKKLRCLENVETEIVQELKKNKYNAWYFSRNNLDLKESLCADTDGWFKCQGSFDKKTCERFHTINPYGSKENRIMFSTWNLDHRIEKSRTVIPALIEAVQKIPKGKTINWKYFYRLLFTVDNLKLVHVACHKKGAHLSAKCDSKKFYI